MHSSLLAIGLPTTAWGWVGLAVVAFVVVPVLTGKALRRASAGYAPMVRPAAALPPMVANRRRLDHDLPAALEAGAGVGLLVVGVDDFASYVRAHGAVVAGTVRREVSSLLATQLRPDDIVYGDGAGFYVLLAGATPQEAEVVAERIRAAVESANLPGAGVHAGGRVTVSVGVAMAREADGADAVTTRAGRALVDAWTEGSNRIAVAA
jgi:diguanylate cyclase (GGDEF)-like protein